MFKHLIVLCYFATSIFYMLLSVIIVNYNVKYFLEQCLYSVQKAIVGLDAEVIVVDNHSTDDSIAYLQPKFKFVQFISSNENLGFGKANNLALANAKGSYILFLNPDTIVAEDCFTKCISFFDLNKDCGALGIKMIDGSGKFLAESKRSFPSPITSFFKLTGLAALFPQSKIFNKYSLGYLSINENHEVDVLCGAFMMLKKEVAEKTNGFDTAFFMYGEDIDLSFRIQKLGYKNYYFSESSIIHFKGESATQQSFKHNKMFYKAMIVFVKKHYGGSKATLFLLLLQLAIVFRAIVGWLGKLVKFVFSISASKQTENFLLLGEATETEKVKQLLITKKIEVLPIKDASHLQLSAIKNKDVVFCEGYNLSNSQIIALMQNPLNNNNFWFHAQQSSSIIGSNSKNDFGKVIV